MKSICYVVDDNYHDLAINSIECCMNISKQDIQYYILGNITNKHTYVKYIDLPSQLKNTHIIDQKYHLPEIMNSLGVDKFLYLDADTIPLKCPGVLIDTDISRVCVGGCLHMFCNNWEQALLWSDTKDGGVTRSYIPNENMSDIFMNAGVILFNTREYISQDILSRYLFLKSKAKLPYPGDEWFFNYAVINKRKILDSRWNWHPTQETTQWTRPYIIHDLGTSTRKPRHSSIY